MSRYDSLLLVVNLRATRLAVWWRANIVRGIWSATLQRPTKYVGKFKLNEAISMLESRFQMLTKIIQTVRQSD